MPIKIGINGLGRIGRLVFRIIADTDDLICVRVNDPGADAETLAHLINFDSIHGKWQHNASPSSQIITTTHPGKQTDIQCSQNRTIEDTDWSDCDIVIDASGRIKTQAQADPFFTQGVKRVIVTAPIKEEGVLNVVMGVNDHLYDPNKHKLLTAASCTTNCIAPVVKIIDEQFNIKHASMTTIHALTNTQTILDAPHKDLRRARACGMNLIPTTTGSATAIGHIFPHLAGKINGHAVRVPLECPSITDMVFEVGTETDAKTVNEQLSKAAEGALTGILGFETRPLVSVDYKTDPRSSIVDAPSTIVVNKTHIKIYAWYDNEWGYANRTVDLAKKIG